MMVTNFYAPKYIWIHLMSDPLSKIRHAAMGQAEAHNWVLKASQILATVVLPALFALLFVFKNEWPEDYSGLFWVLFFFFVLCQIVLFTFNLQSARSVYDILFHAESIQNENDRIAEEFENMKDDLEQSVHLSHYAKTWIIQILGWHKNIKADPKNLQEAIDELIAPMVSEEKPAFDLLPREHLKLVLYFWDTKSEELVPLWKHETTSGKKIIDGKSRTWGSGVGHVGIAFSKNEAIYSVDVSAEGTSEIFRAPINNRKSYDDTLYRSLVSIPLTNGHNEGNPYGVLVATSNMANRFQKERSATFIDTVADAIQAILANIEIDKLVAGNDSV